MTDAGLRAAANKVSDALADWAATGHGPHIDVMDDEGMAFLAAIKVLRAALASSPAPAGLDDAGLDDWTDGYRGLAERMHEVWVLAGRPDPFDHAMEAWRGFALAVRAATRPAEDTYNMFTDFPDARPAEDAGERP